MAGDKGIIAIEPVVTPTRRFAATSPLKGEVDGAAPASQPPSP
jgi:hypothetical protein